ncbi:MAG TPA: hypothetical protein VJ623_00745 [Holophagaceae bacterium]|nr:hypothetical protein [Holophagaceae bacterium]
MRLAEARRRDGGTFLIAPLPSDGTRMVDLTALEAIRLAKLGEGEPETLARALVPPSLDALLAAGPRGLARARQALAYAQKWENRGILPDELASPRWVPRLGPPKGILSLDGRRLDPAAVLKEGHALSGTPQATLCLVGQAGGLPAGLRMALLGDGRLLLSPWLETEGLGPLQLSVGGHKRKVTLEAWNGLDLPLLEPGEHLLLPAPRLRPWPSLSKGAPIELRWGADRLQAHLARALDHPTVQ